jgi:hypothetical protein
VLPPTSNFRSIQTEVFFPAFTVSILCHVNSIGYAFRSDGRYFVLAERHKSKDTLGLYDTTESYKLTRVCYSSHLDQYDM